MLVEEAKVGGAQRVQCPRVYQDLRLLAGVAKPASVTVYEDSHESPSVEGTLSSPDLAGRLFPVVPAGIPLPVGPVGPVGPVWDEIPVLLDTYWPGGPNILALLVRLGCCPRSTLTLLARWAQCTWPGGLVRDVVPV